MRTPPTSDWGLITSTSTSTGDITLHYEPLAGNAFAPASSDLARKAVEFYVLSQREDWSAEHLLQKLGELARESGLQFLQQRPPGAPAHQQVVAFSTGERLG